MMIMIFMNGTCHFFLFDRFCPKKKPRAICLFVFVLFCCFGCQIDWLDTIIITWRWWWLSSSLSLTTIVEENSLNNNNKNNHHHYIFLCVDIFGNLNLEDQIELIRWKFWNQDKSGNSNLNFFLVNQDNFRKSLSTFSVVVVVLLSSWILSTKWKMSLSNSFIIIIDSDGRR